MKVNFASILLILIHYGAVAQNNQMSKEKAGIIYNIITEITKDREVGPTLVVTNMGYKPVDVVRGIAAGMQISKDVIEDTIAANYCRELIKSNLRRKEIINFKTFKEINFNNRYQVINSQFFFLDTAISKTQNKTYIEINDPIDGWDVCKLFIDDSLISGERYTRFLIPRICIPVFIYSNKKDAESIELYLFRFEMQYKDEKFETKFLDYKRL